MNGKVKLERDKITGAYNINILVPDNWKLYFAKTDSELQKVKVCRQGRGNEMVSIPCSPKERLYFRIETNGEFFIFSEKRLNMQGAYNMRDLGGFETKDKKNVSYGKVFRSDDLFQLTSDDLELLQNLNLHTVLDFRSHDEVLQAPDKTLEFWDIVELPINPGSMTNASVQEILNYSEEQVKKYVKGIYEYLGDGNATKEYKKFFDKLLANKNGAIVFHCSAGKDRTGLGAALLLYALGVEEELIYEDYLLSNEYIKDKYAHYLKKYPQLEEMFRVEKEYLQEAFERITKKFGSAMNYIEKELGVDIDKLRDIYLIK